MLTIRAEQMEAFALEARRALAAVLLPATRRALSKRLEKLDDAAVLAELLRCIEHAERHGFEAPPDVFQFAVARIMLGAEFDTRVPWAAAALGAAQREKLPRLFAAMKASAGDV